VKICFFNRSYWPDQAATGQLLTELAEDLVSRHGCEVTVVAGRALHAAGQQGRRIAPVERETHHGVTILRANGTSFRPQRFAGRAANYLTYFGSATLAGLDIGRPDVVVSLTDPPIIGLAARWAARRAGARFVFLCEDIFPEVATLLDDFHNDLVNRSLDRVNRYLLREADAVVALGDRMRRRLVEAIVPGPKDNAFTHEHGLGDRFVLMHSGNMGMSQNLDVLIEAAARLAAKDRLVIALVGDGAKRSGLEQAAAQRGLTNVRFFPYQPKARLHESFAAADAFLVSLKAGIEGYIVPSKVYGVLAAGRPYIAAMDESAEAAAIARDQSCGVLAAPGDPDALAGAIATLYDDPALTGAMGRRARAAALQFDRRVAVAAYYNLFARVAGLARAA
jgi:colanic acid biosynthesis glycosyl transferase WcaI